jgi:hypothetical protein
MLLPFFRGQWGECARNAGFTGVSEAIRRKKVVNIAAFVIFGKEKAAPVLGGAGGKRLAKPWAPRSLVMSITG